MTKPTEAGGFLRKQGDLFAHYAPARPNVQQNTSANQPLQNYTEQSISTSFL